MRSSASFALLFMLTFVFLNGTAAAQSAGPAGQSSMTAQPTTVEHSPDTVENMVGDTLANSTWLDMVANDATNDVTAGDAGRLDKIAAANVANRDNVPSVTAPSFNKPVMQLAASTMAVNFKTRDRTEPGDTSSAVMRMPTALSLLTISLIVLTLFEHRRRQP